jgi:signal transduction histidine kinase/CheY-like chemotaxis protein
MSTRLLRVAIRAEPDVVAARRRARQISRMLGFAEQDQVRIATAVSEIARNAFSYAGGGSVDFDIEGDRVPQLLAIEVKDSGPGIANLDAVLQGRYQSSTGMGLGITGARRLMDYFAVRTSAGSTSVSLKKLLPESAPEITLPHAARIADELAAERGAPSALEEVQEQNRELLRILDELRHRQEDLRNVNRELEDTNRGVVALYAELEERADYLRRADEMKSRFLSNMSHEFRTPLNSIRALTHLLLQKTDGPINEEQRKQLEFVRKGADTLTELVDDLLDIAKIEAGKTEVRPVEISVANLFNTLRGMLRPLLLNDNVALRFESGAEVPAIYSDEPKVAQILRNLISNALKFTERGEISCTATLCEDGSSVSFAVEDTGIGIALEDQETIFEEFTQLRNPLQGRVKGSGLGLPLCRRLAALLRGSISVSSVPGKGSVFTLMLPIRYAALRGLVPERADELEGEAARIPVLAVDDDAESQLTYEQMARGSSYAIVPARSLRQGKDALARFRPAAIIMDVKLGIESSWAWLGELKSMPETAHLPIIVSTHSADPRKSYALGADAYLDKPVSRTAFLRTLNEVTRSRILLIDDDPASRYTLRKLLDAGKYHVLEAADAEQGLRIANTMQPHLVFLDLNLPDRRGDSLLEELVTGELTKGIPVVIATSQTLNPAERERLGRRAAAVLHKGELDKESIQRTLIAISERPASAA